MKKNSFIKKIKEKIKDFFEEKICEPEEEEINFKNLIIMFLIGFVIICIIYTYTNKGFEFHSLESNNIEKIKNIQNQHIEDYFLKKNGLENSDFSKNISHWSISNGEFYNSFMANITLNKESYHSPLQSLQINCFEPSCRIYYNTQSNVSIMDNPFEFESGTWIGVEPETKIKLSYWYTGCKHHITFLNLNKSGDIFVLKNVINNFAKKWVKKEITIKIPKETIAFGINIFIGKDGYLLLDDIQIERT